MTTTNYNNLQNLKRFAADESVQHVNMSEIIEFIRGDHVKGVEGLDPKYYGAMLTEMGFCYTTSFVRWYGHRGIGKYASLVLGLYKTEFRFGYLDDRVWTWTLMPFSMGQQQNLTIASFTTVFFAQN